MSEKEKKALDTIFKAIPKMSEFQKGRLYGMAEAMEEQNKSSKEKDNMQNINKINGE
ncbi:MAG: hypothetical protein K2O02_00555 [Lachnospiraceae bacterium]|nr:hypothetical protein [Lachnospiraceae bacterium]